MADADTIRRRELRKRKILEHSEARLNRITNAKRNEDTSDKTEKEEINSKANDVIDAHTSFPASQEAVRNVNSYNLTSTTESYGFNRSRNRVSDEDSYNVSSNGSAQRSPAVDNYIFPKKVSDAETRSFVRSRCDARRNSTCTQIMMETFQSSFSLAVLRPWITAILSVILKCYFLLTGKFPFFQTLLFPYFLLEIAFCSWTKFELQVNSRQNTSFIPGILLLCGVPLHIVSGINSVLYLVKSAIQDLAVYIFSFVFFHFMCEIYM